MSTHNGVAVGENITVSIEGDVATIRINLKRKGDLSKSGKSVMVATTGGNVVMPGTDVILGLNAYRKAR